MSIQTRSGNHFFFKVRVEASVIDTLTAQMQARQVCVCLCVCLCVWVFVHTMLCANTGYVLSVKCCSVGHRVSACSYCLVLCVLLSAVLIPAVAPWHSKFPWNFLVFTLQFSFAIFRRVTPPTVLRKPRQYIHQNLRLDQGRGAMTFGVEIPIFPKVIPKTK